MATMIALSSPGVWEQGPLRSLSCGGYNRNVCLSSPSRSGSSPLFARRSIHVKKIVNSRRVSRRTLSISNASQTDTSPFSSLPSISLPDTSAVRNFMYTTANTATSLSETAGRSALDASEQIRRSVDSFLVTKQGPGIGVTGPAQFFSQLGEAVASGYGQVSRIAGLEVEHIKDEGITLMSSSGIVLWNNAQGIVKLLEHNPTLARLGGSAGSAVQSGEALILHTASRLTSTASLIGHEPAIVSHVISQTASAVFSSLLTSAETSALALSQQPGALPAVASIVGIFLGVGLGNLIVVALNDAGRDLPSRYEPAAIASYFQRRPVLILLRSLKIFAECSVVAASIIIDRAQGVTNQNERMRAKQTVDLITRLGPTAIKVGQALSIRPDLLSLTYLEELQTLQDRVPPFSNAEARQLILEGLGRPADDIYTDISPMPVAAASLGQVYKARLQATGDLVAVKVQRPDVLEGICADLYVLRVMATLLKKLPSVYTDLEAVLDGWAGRFFDELDYVQEGRNAVRFANDMRMLKNVTVPTVFPEYTSRKVLTSAWVEGEKLSESRAADLGSLVTTALNCYLIQLLETGFLHADPHPGNLLRTPDGKLCVLDFGLMTEVTVDQQYALLEYISHIVNNDYARVAEDLVVLGFVPPELVDPEKTAAVVPQLSKVLGQLVQGGGARNVNVAQVTDDLARMSEDYVFVIPPYFALILRAFGVLEGIGLDNDPNYAIVDECYPYLCKRLLTDDNPRTRAALRYFLYGRSDRLNVERVEEIAVGFQSFRDLMAPLGGAGGALPVSATPPLPPPRTGVDPTAREALELVFATEGSYLQDLLLTEVVRAVDALSREALSEIWAFFAARALVPLPAPLAAPGSWPLPLPGMVGGVVRGQWVMGRVSEEDQQALGTVRRLWALLEPNLSRTSTPGSPADFLEIVRDVGPLAWTMLPGISTAAQRFLIMLMQRQALRLADDLDGGNSVAMWDADPAAFSRFVQPNILVEGRK